MRFRAKLNDLKIEKLKDKLLGNIPSKVKKELMGLTKKMESLANSGEQEKIEILWCDIIRGINTNDLTTRVSIILYFHLGKYEMTLNFPHCGFMECLKLAKQIESNEERCYFFKLMKEFAGIAEEEEWSKMIKNELR